MLINALRFKDDSGSTSALRVSGGTGRFRNYACIAGPEAHLRRALAAVNLALTGRVSALVSEVELSLSDDAGHTWLIRRQPGNSRIEKDGRELAAGPAERQLLAALLDADLSVSEQMRDAEHGADMLARRIVMQADGIQVTAATDDGPQAGDTLRAVAERQIRDIVHACAQTLQRPQLENPVTLARFARVLEPLHVRYRELCTQYHDVKDKSKGDSKNLATPAPQADAAALRAELVVIRDIAAAAEALLKPGASPKAWRDELTAVESQIAELAATHGLADGATGHTPKDWRKPIDALAKLEAHARLIRAAQATRKQCETDVEPLLRQYWDLIGQSLSNDARIVSNLENCLQTLNARLADARARDASPQHMDLREGADSLGIKTWFDRFRVKQQAEMDANDHDVNDLETARDTITLALRTIQGLSKNLSAAKPRFAGTLKRFDDAHEDLVKHYGTYKSEWLAIAKAEGLPESLTLDGMFKLLTDHARLSGLAQRRHELQEKLRDASARLARLASLVPQWRQVAGSQKASDLNNPQLLLQEARDIIRYQDAKERRLAQLGEACANQATHSDLQAVLKARRKDILAAWRDAFVAAGIETIDINHDSLPEVFRRATIVRALGLVIGSTGKTPIQDPFAAPAHRPTTTGRTCIASAYLIAEEQTSNPARLALLSALEDAQGSELRLLLVSDESLSAMLASLGIGLAQKITPPRNEPLSAPPNLQTSPRVRPNVIGRGPLPPNKASASTTQTNTGEASKQAAEDAPVQRRELNSGEITRTITNSGRAVPAPILSDKARQALGLLTGRKP